MIHLHTREAAKPIERFAATPLAASRVIDIIDRTFRLYRDKFVSFVALVALISVPITLLELVVDGGQTLDNLNYYRSAVGYLREAIQVYATPLMVFMIGVLLQHVFSYGLIVFITSETVLGRRVSIVEAFNAVSGKLATLMLAWLLVGTVFLISALGLFIAGIFLFVPFLLLPVVFYFGLCVYVFIVPVVILEDVPLLTGVQRALSLAKMRFWRVLGFVVGIWLITLVLSQAFEYFTEFVLGTTRHRRMILIVVRAIIDLFIQPVLPVGLTLLYYDARIRSEGLDLALRLTHSAEPRLTDVISPQPGEALIVGRDIRNIVIFTVALTVMFCSLSVLIGVMAQALV